MAGSRIGGLKAAAKNLESDPDFYKKIALKAQESWAKNGRKPRGFAYDRDVAREAGRKGGSISRRTKKSPVSDSSAVTTDENQVIETIAAAKLTD